MNRSTDVLIVGGGPSGLSAAAALRASGASVVVAEREVEAGGIPRHTEHLGYGIRDLHRVLSGPAYAGRLVARATDAGAELVTSATVLALDGTQAELVTPAGPVHVDARAVVLATGTRERPRAARLVAGDRPAGVLTTGALQQFRAFLHQPVGRRAVVVGAEHVSFSAVLTLRHLGCDVVAMTTPHVRHQTYAPLRWAAAGRARVPIHTGVDVDRIEGRRRVEAIVLTDGTRVECDTVVFTGDWVPDHELARRTGCAMVPVAKAPAIDAGFHTTAAGVFAVGNLVHPAETADVCALDGVRVASRVVDFLEHGRWATPAAVTVESPVAWASWTARGVTLRVSTFVTGRVEIMSGDRVVATTRRRHLVPNRSITVPVPATQSLDQASLRIRLL